MQKTHISDFTRGNIPKQLIIFASPLFLSILLQVVYNMVDPLQKYLLIPYWRPMFAILIKQGTDKSVPFLLFYRYFLFAVEFLYKEEQVYACANKLVAGTANHNSHDPKTKHSYA